MYDIRKSSPNYGGRPVWGREYYAPDGAGMYVPVLFVPYFERKNWSKGIKQIWEDRKRILSGEWYGGKTNV